MKDDFEQFLHSTNKYFREHGMPEVLDSYSLIFNDTPKRQSEMGDHLQKELDRLENMLGQLKERRTELIMAGQKKGMDVLPRILEIVSLADDVILEYKDMKENAERRFRFLTGTPTDTEAINARLKKKFEPLFHRLSKLLENEFLEDCGEYYNWRGTQDLFALVLYGSLKEYSNELEMYFLVKGLLCPNLGQAFKNKQKPKSGYGYLGKGVYLPDFHLPIFTRVLIRFRVKQGAGLPSFP